MTIFNTPSSWRQVEEIVSWISRSPMAEALAPDELFSDQMLISLLSKRKPKMLPRCSPYAIGHYCYTNEAMAFLYGQDGETPITELDETGFVQRVKAYLLELSDWSEFDPDLIFTIDIFFPGEFLYEEIERWEDWSPNARISLLLACMDWCVFLTDSTLAFADSLCPSELLVSSIRPFIDWDDLGFRMDPVDMLNDPLLSSLEFHFSLISGFCRNPYIGYLDRDGEYNYEFWSISADDYEAMTELMNMADYASKLEENLLDETPTLMTVFETLTKFDTKDCEDFDDRQTNYYIRRGETTDC